MQQEGPDMEQSETRKKTRKHGDQREPGTVPHD